MALRNFETGRNVPGDRQKAKRPGHAPYGYGYLDGELIVDPREYTVVKKILHLWKVGKSPNAIARELNAAKIPTRLVGSWYAPVIRAIIRREETDKPKAK